MREIAPAERLFFAIIAVAALFVTYLGFFVPARMDRSFTWASIPPLHARFVGLMYLFGGVFMIGCLLARRRSHIGPAIVAIGIFTGLLLVATLLNLEAFDFSRGPVWVWTVSYTVYPGIAAALLWRARGRTDPAGAGRPLAPWARGVLIAQATVAGVTGLLLLVVPGGMVELWPWPIDRPLAQFYAGPLLAYAYCSWRFASGSWSDVATVAPAMLIFTAGTIVASLVHRNLFTPLELADLLWFVLFGLLTLALMPITGIAARARAFGESRT